MYCTLMCVELEVHLGGTASRVPAKHRGLSENCHCALWRLCPGMFCSCGRGGLGGERGICGCGLYGVRCCRGLRHTHECGRRAGSSY